MTDERRQPRLLHAGMEWATPADGVCDFAAAAADGKGGVWLAALAYGPDGRSVRVTRVFGAGAGNQTRLAVAAATGMGPPAVCATADGCAVAVPVEQEGRWRIACFFLGADGVRGASPVFLDAGGSVNCTASVAAIGPDIHAVWQANAGEARAIYWARVTGRGRGEAVRLSAEDFHSQNPAIVDCGGGEGFAAWDSIRGDGADIYGARFSGGAWSGEQRLTADARIERHPCLASHGGAVWMAWQAQAYEGRRINCVTEQRIAAGRLDAGGLTTVAGWFEEVSPEGALLVRPTIALDGAGRLWLAYRRSEGPQKGWRPEVRVHDGRGWSPAMVPTRHAGRWRPVRLLPLGDRGLWLCQCDDLPTTWNEQGIWPEWHSWIEVGACRVEAAFPPAAAATEPLVMPRTSFDLAEKRALCAADLPEQRARVGEADLLVCWGDLHDHTDLSVCDRAKNPPGADLFANERDIERLDFCALTDHGYNMDRAQWTFNSEQTRMYHDPHRFVTFLGQEWTSDVAPPADDGSTNRYGHRNLVFLDPHHPRYYDAHDGDISPADLWAEIGAAEALCIPHQLACWEGKGLHNVPVQWGYVDERMQPVAEICQTRGSYEGLGCPYLSPGATPWAGHFLQDVWQRGLIIGVIASPDHGGGRGKVGVWAASRTRADIFAAIRARHTFGTSGAKMSLLFRSGGAMMGDVAARPPDGPLTFTIDAVCLRPIRELSILRNNEAVFQAGPQQAQCHLTWADADPPRGRLWYYVRMTTAEDEWAWSSPIWFG